MAARVCPWWAVPFTIDPPLRRWIHDPQKIVGPYLKPGMTVIDVGCGVGWFAIPMARMVGQHGRIIAVDLQPQMLDMLRRRAAKAGVADRIEMHPCAQDRLGLEAQADFALAFAMLHEVPDQRRLLGELHACLKPAGKLLLAEPPIHVSRKAFANEVAHAEAVGFQIVDQPRVRWCHAVLFTKAESVQEKAVNPVSQRPNICEVAHGSAEYWATVELRTAILRKPIGLHYRPGELEAEKDAHHIVCYRGKSLVGCLMLSPREDGDIQMRQVAVASELQRQGIGRALVEYSEAWARNAGYRRMILHSREAAVPFYENLGYAKLGDRFEEVTLPHWLMEKRLPDLDRP